MRNPLPTLECQDAALAQAIQCGAQPEYAPALCKPQPSARSERYVSWDEFRSSSPAVQRELLDLATKVLPDLRGMKLRPIPESVPATDTDLGCPLASLALDHDVPRRAGLGLQRAFYAAGLCATLVLIAFLWQSGSPSTALYVGTGMSILLVAFCAASWYGRFQTMSWHADLGRVLQSAHLWLFDNGILWQQGPEFSRCRWEDIDGFEIAGDSAQPRFRIMPRDAAALEVSLASSPAILPLADYMEIKIASAQLVPRLQHIIAGESVRFGKVVLDRRHFTSPGFTAPWTELIRVMTDRTNVFVDRRDQSTWLEISCRDVSCPLLLVALTHILIEDADRLP